MGDPNTSVATQETKDIKMQTLVSDGDGRSARSSARIRPAAVVSASRLLLFVGSVPILVSET
jgi:hypothetical protein